MRITRTIPLLLASLAAFVALAMPAVALADGNPTVYVQNYESGVVSDGWTNFNWGNGWNKIVVDPGRAHTGTRSLEDGWVQQGYSTSGSGTHFVVPIEGYKYEWEAWVFVDKATSWGMTSNWAIMGFPSGNVVGGEASTNVGGSKGYVRPQAGQWPGFTGDSWNQNIPQNMWHQLKVTYDRRAKTFSFQVDGIYYAKNLPAPTNEAPSHVMAYSGGGWVPNIGYHSYFDDLVLRVWRDDATAPVTTMHVDPTQPNGQQGWYVSQPTVSLVATDNGGTGVAKTEYSLDGTTWKTYTGPFVIEAEGTTTIRYRSTDKNGNVEAVKSGSLKVDRTAPVSAIDVADPDGEDGWYNTKPTITLSAADTGGSGLAKTQYSVDGGDWTTYTGAFTVDPEGAVTVRYRSLDAAGNVEAEKSVSLKIDTVAPAIALGADEVAVDEGQPAANMIEATDELGATTVTVSDGELTGGEGSWDWNLATTDGPADGRTVTVTASDGHGNSATATFELTVHNVAPTASIAPLPTTALSKGTALKVSGSFADPGADTHMAEWSWGDGTGSAGTVDQAASSVTGEHVYAKPGLYTVTLTVTDKDGGAGSAVATGYVVVYDTSAGFLTGGGWIGTGSGKATFGLNAKYQKGASVPTGQTEFQAKGVNFHSTSYDWLVVSGCAARYSGSGTVNGAGDYGFLVVAADGGKSDAFRIKIWDKSTGAVVFDDQPGATDASNDATVLGGGNLTIHK